jgi:hypothetical protein
MPATVIGSAEWNTRGIVLSSQSAQEQINGLVNVQVEYALPASKQYQIDRMFFVDAPPPIWPTVVNRAEMLTNNLYMTQRSISRANGLVTVNAEYVSGLKRAGSRGYFLRTNREPEVYAIAYDNLFSGVLVIIDGTTLNVRGDFIKHTFEFVQIGESTAVKLPTLDVRDVYKPTSAYFSFGGTVLDDLSQVFTRKYIRVYNNARRVAKSEGVYLPAESSDKFEYVTPSVKIVHRELFF